MLSGKSILVTGGTGSFGKSFVRRILVSHPDVRRLVVFSRDELKQFDMAQEFPPAKYPALRFFLGDIRDENVPAMVLRADLEQSLMGMSYLSRFARVSIEGNRLILER